MTPRAAIKPLSRIVGGGLIAALMLTATAPAVAAPAFALPTVAAPAFELPTVAAPAFGLPTFAAPALELPVREVAPQVAPPDTAELRRTLEAIAGTHEGVVGISVRDLDSGAAVSIRGDEPFPSASLVKIAVLVTLLDEVEEGRMALDERASLIARDRVGGSGVLKHMDSGLSPTLEDHAWLMMTLSDNTATNLLLDRLDIRTVGLKMESLGLPRTKIHSKTFRRATSIAPDSSVLYGLGVTSPDETTSLLAMLHEGRAVSPAADSLAMQMLLANQDGNGLVRWLPSGTRVAHKSGSIDRARNDCGIIYSPAAPIALCVMTRENADTSYRVDNAAHLLIGRIAREVYAHWNPDVELPPVPVWDGG